MHHRIHSSNPLWFQFYSPTLGCGSVTQVRGDLVKVVSDKGSGTIPYELFLSDGVFLSESDLDSFFDLLDQEICEDPIPVVLHMRTGSEEHGPGSIWKTDSGKWRSISKGGVAKSFDSKEDAQSHARGSDGGDSHGEGSHSEKSLKDLAQGFLKKFKNLPKTVLESVQKAPEKVQRFVSDPEHRSSVLKGMGKSMKDGASKIPSILKKATKEEIAEISHGVSAVKKLAKGGKLTKHDRDALYAVGTYVAVVAVAGATGGAALASGAFGKAFAKHLAAKSIGKLVDKGFTHFEMGESALHGLHTLSHALHLANRKYAGDEGDEGAEVSEEDLREIVLTYVHEAIRQEIEKGLSDEDLSKILESMGSDSEESKGSKKSSNSLRARTIRLAYTRPDLRPTLLSALK